MSSEGVSPVMPLDNDLPILILQRDAKTIAVIKDNENLINSFLPFSLKSCNLIRLTNEENLKEANETGILTIKKFNWDISVKVKVSLDDNNINKDSLHWIILTGGINDKSKKIFNFSFKSNKEGLNEVLNWLNNISLKGFYEMYLVSEPELLNFKNNIREIGCLRNIKIDEKINERIILGQSSLEIANVVNEFLNSFFFNKIKTPTAIFWPPTLTYPVNIHYSIDKLRITEHDFLLLPMRSLLHLEQRIKEWPIDEKLLNINSIKNNLIRTGSLWEKHLIKNPHTFIKNIPQIKGGKLFLVSGFYDYYHYRVDGFNDDKWGCAYRSLQTILSWFQHEGLMEKSMPNIRNIQEILSIKDSDKINRKNFVGSKDWIGSFEIMIVLQYYIPGIECLIKRMESGSDLDNDPNIQQILINHFSQKRACPVMIGGSSYAHTILGVNINLSTMEAQYLIADPHYSSNETVIKRVINKGYVGWKEAGKFFESQSWYNLCIPQINLYDPR